MDSLELKGLHIDELQKLRVMDPELSAQTTSLKTECGEFVTQGRVSPNS
jgi:intraflagellar transport protein 20